MGVYGSFITNFPELFERMEVWEENKEHIKIKGIYIPENGMSLMRLKGGIDLTGLDALYVLLNESKKIKLGMFFQRKEKNAVFRIVKEVEYQRAGDYKVYLIEKVSGENDLQRGLLNIASPLFT